MRKEEQHAPLLSDREMFDMQDAVKSDVRCCDDCMVAQATDEIRDWYEAMITNGALMVPKTCSLSNVSMLLSNPPWYKYHCCGRKYLEPLEVGEFCRCGAKIIA